MADTYQDINALLATLSSYTAFSNASDHGQTANSMHQTRPSPPYNLASQDQQHLDVDINNQTFLEQQYLNSTQRGILPEGNQTPLLQLSGQDNTSHGPMVSSHSLIRPDQPQLELLGTDARTITEWRQALRHVNKLASRNSMFGERIKKLIANQLDNERQWWFGREALIEKQKNRVAGKQELDSILRGIGASRGEGNTKEKDQESDAAELKRYDLKVYKAMTEMGEAIYAELESLGVPFYGTEASLILEETEQHASKQVNGKISRSELHRLRSKMIEHLEDLYKE